MRARPLPIIALMLVSAVVSVTPAAADDPTLPPVLALAAEMPEATATTASANLAAEETNAGILADNVENVTCQYKPTFYAANSQTDLGPAVVKAEDIAGTPAVECISLDPLSPEYDIVFHVSFEYWNTTVTPKRWDPVPAAPIKECKTGSLLRQAVHVVCVHRVVYEVNDPNAKLNTIHRAKFDLQQPLDLAPTHEYDVLPVMASDTGL